MRLIGCAAAGALILAGLFVSSPAVNAGAAATVLGGINAATGNGDGLVQKVSGCHRHPEYHHVYLWGYPAWHRHGGNCAPIPASPPVYAPPAYPPYPGYGAPGFGAPAYCHGNWQNHFHPGFGYGWHRHAGPNCKPVRGRRWRSGPKTGCVNIAGIWICG